MTSKVSPIECDQNYNPHWNQQNHSEKDTNEAIWIRQNIKLRKRIRYMPSDDKENEDEIEQMQIPISTISQEVGTPSAELNMNFSEHEYTITTDAFGEIKFIDPLRDDANIAKFVRADSMTDTSTILDLMTKVWGMKKPNLLISVTGGTGKCNIDPELKNAFKYELVKAANSTDAWIITGGTYTGVSSHVGEAAEYYGLTTINPNCALIGIAPWGVIQNRKVLVDEQGSWPANYDTDEKRNEKEIFLDPNHSHFILIDDGTEHVYNTEISFRAKLERKISENQYSKGDDNSDEINLGNVVSAVPRVLLVLEGGTGTLKTVENALKENTPVVIVKKCLMKEAQTKAYSLMMKLTEDYSEGSGRAADILAFAFKYSSDAEDDEEEDNTLMYEALEDEIRKQLKDIEECSEKMLNDTITLINTCLDKSNLINICKWNAGSGDLDLETAILKALLKAHNEDNSKANNEDNSEANNEDNSEANNENNSKANNEDSSEANNEENSEANNEDNSKADNKDNSEANNEDNSKANNDQVMDHLGLALAWEKIDIARNEIFTDDKIWPTGKLDDIMLLALVMDRVNFVELFIENGINLKEFLTNERLLLLYNNQSRTIEKQFLDSLFRDEWQENKKDQSNMEITLYMVGRLMQDLLGDYYYSHYISKKTSANANMHLDGERCSRCMKLVENILDTPSVSNTDSTVQTYDFDNPPRELFIWSVLNNRLEMSEFFWHYGKDAIAAALVAHALLFAMSRRADSKELIEQYTANAEVFTELAIGVLKECQIENKYKTHRLLIRRVPEWGETSCILIAVEAKNEQFISQPECQDLFRTIWNGQMTQANGPLKLLLCALIPPLIPLLAKFEENENGKLAREEQETQKFDQQFLRCTCNTSLKQSNCSPQAQENKADSKHDAKVDANSLDIKKKFVYFYRAPVVVFCHNVITYMIFLVLYSYILIFRLKETPSMLEYVLFVWILTFVSEEFRQVYKTAYRSWKTKFRCYIKDGWNKLDIITILLFVIGLTLRLIPHPLTLEAARVFLGADLVMFYMKMLHIFRVHKEFGPKLIMIIRAAQSLAYFFVIIFVFIVAYAVASHGILYPNAELNLDSLIAIFRRPYWNIYGELMLEEIEGSMDCTNDEELYRNGTYSRCPTVSGQYFVPLLMGLYLLICNILLLNLLVAVFTDVFSNEEWKTNLYWNQQLNNLIDEYGNRSIFPPPFTVIEHVYRLIVFIVKKCQNSSQTNSSAPRRGPFLIDLAGMDDSLREWENEIADRFRYQRKQAPEDDTDQSSSWQFEQLEKKLTKMQMKQQALIEIIEDRQQALIETIEDVHSKKLESMEKQLMWIVDSLREHNLGSSRDISEVESEHV